MTITEFLLSRIEEDEKVARAAIRSGDGTWTAGEQFDVDGEVYDRCAIFGDDLHIYDEGGHDENHAEHIARHDPARVLAECAAKRAIIESLTNTSAAHASETHIGQKLVLAGMDTGLRLALNILSVPYRDHPDYREEWAL